MRPLSTKQLAALGVLTVSVVLLSVRLMDQPRYVTEQDKQYDFIVVGAGTAGCVLAERLSANPLNRVLLIESGGDAPWYSWIPFASPLLQGSRHDWEYRTVTQKHAAGALRNRQSFWPQGKMLGGTGQMNFLIHNVGSPDDFDSWNVDGWDSEALGPVFQRLSCWMGQGGPNPTAAAHFTQSETCSLRGHHREGQMTENETMLEKECGGSKSDAQASVEVIRQCPLAAIKLQQINASASPLTAAFLQAGRSLGHPVLNNNQWSRDQRTTWGFMASQNTIHQGTRWSTYQSHLKPALQRPNLHVLLHSTVSKLLMNGNRVHGVQFIDGKGSTKHVLARKDVVLSAGSIKSPQILQLSGIGPSHVLEPLDIPVVADLPVGDNLQDHLQVPLFVELVNSSVSVNVAKVLRPTQLWNYFVHQKGIIGTSGIEAIATFPASNSTTGPDGMLILFNMGSIDAAIYSKVANIRIEAFRRWFPKSDNFWQEGFVLISVCLHPSSRGHIRIKSTDPLHPPEIDPRYLSHPDDVQCLANTIKQGARLMETEPFKKLGARLTLPQFSECTQQGPPNLDDPVYMECLVRMSAITMYHPASTCSMGNKDDIRSSVVDPSLRVRGIQGLRVVDASILPRLTSGPPNSVLVAVAEKAARLINNETK